MERYRVAVIGTGASAAFAFKACKDYGCSEIDVYGKFSENFPQGAFWLKWVPSDVLRDTNAKKEIISIAHLGTPKDYLVKQWGHGVESNTINSSFAYDNHEEYGYNQKIVWTRMWEGANFIDDRGMFTDLALIDLKSNYDFVFHTFPSTVSLQTHSTVEIPTVSFHAESQPLFHTLKLMNRKFELVNQIIYDGRRETSVVRISCLFGRVNIEFIQKADPSRLFTEGVVHGKFMDIVPNTQELTDVDNLVEGVYPVGRYAQWSRHMLSHEAYKRVMVILTGG